MENKTYQINSQDFRFNLLTESVSTNDSIPEFRRKMHESFCRQLSFLQSEIEKLTLSVTNLYSLDLSPAKEFELFLRVEQYQKCLTSYKEFFDTWSRKTQDDWDCSNGKKPVPRVQCTDEYLGTIR